jgi:DNA-binding transcriptional ArsR family regulator
MSRAAGSGGALRRRQHAAAFAALGDETRLSLVSELAGGAPRSIAQLTDGARMSRQAISKHLRVLEHAGIVRSSRSGRENLFEFNPAPVQELRRYLERVSAQWDEVLGRLKSFVER